MSRPLTTIGQWAFILLVSVWVAFSIQTPLSRLWAFVAVAGIAMIGITRGDPQRMLSWYVFSLATIHLFKRMLFLWGPAPMNVYHHIQAFPLIVMAVMLALCAKQWRTLTFARVDAAVALYFLAGLVITIVRGVGADTGGEAMVSVVQCSGGTLCYYVGRALSPDVWERQRRWLIWVLAGTVVMGTVQFFWGPTPIDVRWALWTGDSSIQGGKVLEYLAGNGEFRPYSTFSDPLAWGFFVIFVWAVIEAGKETAGDTLAARWTRRAFFLLVLASMWQRSAVLAGVGMLAFEWLLRKKIAARPLMLFAVFVFCFVGVVWLTEFLVENVLKAGLLPQYMSAYFQRMLNIGTLSHRGFALEELARALKSYWLIGVGWKDQADLLTPTISGFDYYQSHNGVVNLLLILGLPGLALVVVWFLVWLQKVTATIRARQGTGHVMVRWGTAMCLGFTGTIFFAGQQFVQDGLFWLIVGWTTTASMVAAGPSRKEPDSTL